MMSSSLPASKMAKLSSEKQICDLVDADLAEIFKHLPLSDRLIASEVCRRWHALSRKAWLDVKHIHLNAIPGENIKAVVKQCPNLRSVVALSKSFALGELCGLSRSRSLSSVKLYDCSFAVQSATDPSVVSDGFAKIFSMNLRHASWRELVFHDARVQDIIVSSAGNPAPNSRARARWAFSADRFPSTLTRLQLSHLHVRVKAGHFEELFLEGLERLQNLECLILHHTPFVNIQKICAKICSLKNLRELFVGSDWPLAYYEHSLQRVCSSLTKLEVLFLQDFDGDAIAECLKEIVTRNSVLRILVLSGSVRSGLIEIPPRKRFPHGFGSDPLPLLHIFVGKEASERFRFADSSSDTTVILPIDKPMPEFLEREDVAEIFEGVWIAERIKETAKNSVPTFARQTW